MNLDQALATFIQHRQQRRLSVKSIEQYQYQLEDLWVTWRTAHQYPEDIQLISLEELNSFFSYLMNEHINQHTGGLGLAPATCASSWRILRTFWNFSIRRKWLTEEQHEFFRDDELIARPAEDERMRPIMEDDTFEALLSACTSFGDPEERARNRAIILMLAETGMRVSEIVRMLDKNLRIADRCAKIIGKGNREEWVFWHNRTDRALKAYLRIRPACEAEPEEGKYAGYVFRRLNTNHYMSTSDIRTMAKTLAEIAHVTLPKGAPIHSFRHRFAHKGIDAGLDISQVGQLMRHRHTQTTMRYLRENRERLRKIRDKMEDDD